MRLARKDELDRALGVVDHGAEPLDIRQQQVRSLIGRKAACKADRQCIGRENLAKSLKSCCIFVATLRLLLGPPPYKIEQLDLQREVRFPKLAVIDFLNLLPGAGVAAVCLPVDPEIAIVQPDICGASQDGTCTPLVMWPMGTASSGRPDRDTSTWRGRLPMQR